MTVKKYFERYISIETTSYEELTEFPSSKGQLMLAMVLMGDLHEIGVEAFMDEHGYVYGSIPASEGCENAPAIGLIAHMDTSSSASGKDIKPSKVRYSGGDVVLNEEKNIVLRASENPCLAELVGADLIVTDGTTLLGADDKAGIAEIMALAEKLTGDPSISHGRIAIAFTPEEETGRGTEHFDLSAFGADFAYTVDGGALGELEFENFNAASAKLNISGVSIHPGTAKNRMVNACLLASEFISMLPPAETPSHTEGYEGFYHVTDISGDIEKAEVKLIIRDHSREKFEARKAFVQRIADYMNEKYGGALALDIRDSYYNMREVVEKRPDIIDRARKAFEKNDIAPIVQPIRGGTDGSHLSFMGLICPNLSTGGYNAHGRFEFIPVQAMEKMTDVLLDIIRA